MVRDTPPSQDAPTHQIWNSYLKEYRGYAPDKKRDGRIAVHFITIKTKSKVKVTLTKKMVRDTPPSQDASTHQIWNSYLKEYRRYAPDMKQDGRTDSAITICLPKFLWGIKNTRYIYVSSSVPQWPSDISGNDWLGPINKRYAPNRIILKTRSEVKVTGT